MLPLSKSQAASPVRVFLIIHLEPLSNVSSSPAPLFPSPLTSLPATPAGIISKASIFHLKQPLGCFFLALTLPSFLIRQLILLPFCGKISEEHNIGIFDLDQSLSA